MNALYAISLTNARLCGYTRDLNGAENLSHQTPFTLRTNSSLVGVSDRQTDE